MGFMKEYALVTDATVDLPQAVLEKMQVIVIPMPVRLGETEYMFEPAQKQLTVKEFYQRLRAGEAPETAQINMALFLETFVPLARQGLDILYLGFSSGLSGTYQSALMAAAEMKRLFPEIRVCCVDSLSASIGEGAFVHQAGRLKAQGMGYEALCQWAWENRLNAAHWFTVEDLFHLYRGGRLSKGSAMVGTALNIKPILTMDWGGKLKPSEKVRGKVKALHRMVDLMAVTLTPETDTVIVGHGDDPETAGQLARMIGDRFPQVEIILSEIGPVIGTHVGPGMVAAAYMGSSRAK